MTWIDELKRLHACGEAVDWAKRYADPADAWAECERGDWMLWIAGWDTAIRQGNERHIRLCYAICLIWWELAYPWWYEYGETNDDHRPERAIEALEEFCHNPWAVGAAGAVEAAEGAGTVDAATLKRMADIVRDTCEMPVLDGVDS